jgi:N-acetylglucosamine-6-sulfatase
MLSVLQLDVAVSSVLLGGIMKSVRASILLGRAFQKVGLLAALIISSTGLAYGQSFITKNILVIMTDDQRWDTVSQMPNLTSIASKGVTFPNAFMTSPLCGPSRSMLYSGGYRSQNTGVLGNNPPNGGAKIFNDRDNLGAMLQSAGYRTQFVGKWINGYEGMGKYVPPGWSQWIGRHSFATVANWSSFQYVIGASTQTSSAGTVVTAKAYTTYYERDQVLNFISSTPATQPFFIFWAPSSPHPPATPAPEDLGLFTTYLYRDRGYGDTNLSTKPSWVQHFTPTADGAYGDQFVRNQLQSIQSVDRSVQSVIDELITRGLYDNTVIIFTSDNGYLWGEHGLWGKDKAYQESLRVPLIVLMPGVTPHTDNSLVAASLDIGPTLFEIAGITKNTDGMSLVSLLNTPGMPWRADFFIEAADNNFNGNAIWAGLQNGQYKYVKYWTGEEELYDLNADPYELNNLQGDPTQAEVKTAMSTRTQQLRGLAIIPVNKLPSSRIGVPYRFQMQTWGGLAPFTWTVSTGSLPPGITLDAAGGLISGIPTAKGTYQFSIRIADSSLATQAGKPKTFVSRVLKIIVS